jgi:hypothetical protein
MFYAHFSLLAELTALVVIGLRIAHVPGGTTSHVSKGPEIG